MAKSNTPTAKRVRMVNSYGVPAHPLAEHVPIWEREGWRVEPAPEQEPADPGSQPK